MSCGRRTAANVGTLLRHPDLDPGARQEALVSVDAELVELSTLVDELVPSWPSIADAEPRAVVSVDRVVAEAVDHWRRRRSSHETRLVLAPFTAFGLCRTAVGNLLDNAVKFSPDDTVIEVEVAPAADRSRPRTGIRGDLVLESLLPGGGRQDLTGSGLGLAMHAPCRGGSPVRRSVHRTPPVVGRCSRSAGPTTDSREPPWRLFTLRVREPTRGWVHSKSVEDAGGRVVSPSTGPRARCRAQGTVCSSPQLRRRGAFAAISAQGLRHGGHSREWYEEPRGPSEGHPSPRTPVSTTAKVMITTEDTTTAE